MNETCSYCNGTGIIPVEPWDARRAAVDPHYNRRAAACQQCKSRSAAEGAGT